MRNFCGMLDYQIKHLIRKKTWLVLLGSSVAATIGCFLFAYVLNAEPIMLLSQTVFGQALLTLSLMMIGVELRREDYQEHIDDLVSTYLKKSALYPLSQIMVIAILAGIATVVVCFGCVVPLSIDQAPAEWIKQTSMQIVLMFLIPSIALGSFGLLISYILPGKNVYLLAVLTWLLTSSLSIYFTGPLSDCSEEWRLAENIFSMGFNNYQMFRNVVTGENNELPRWIVRGSVTIIFASLYVACYLKNSASTKRQKHVCKMRIGIIVLMGFAWVTFIGVRYSTFFVSFADDTYTQKLTYGVGEKIVSARNQRTEKWSFDKNISLEKTDIDLSCTTQGMNVKVKMIGKMDSGAAAQSFTLFSEFVIDEIKVDDKEVDYVRNSDGILIYFPEYKEEGETVQIQFEYHGYSLPSYPANETTVQLNRAFAWMPWPGISNISESEMNRYDLTEVFFIDDWQRGDLVEYTLHYDGPENVYTNLEKIQEDTYVGCSDDGVAIYSGMLQITHRDSVVYYPASLYREAKLAAEAIEASYNIIKEYCEYWSSPVMPQKPSTIVIIQMRYPMWGNLFYSSNELYSWDDTWEIRMRNETSSVLSNYKRAEATGEEFESKKVVVDIAIPYLLNPCSGYPLDVSVGSTDCFADLVAFSILADTWDESDQQFYAEMLMETYFNDECDEKHALVSEFVLQMVNGTGLDRKLQEIYKKLCQSESIEPNEMIKYLLSN